MKVLETLEIFALYGGLTLAAGGVTWLLMKIPFVNYWVHRIRHETEKLPKSDPDDYNY